MHCLHLLWQVFIVLQYCYSFASAFPSPSSTLDNHVVHHRHQLGRMLQQASTPVAVITPATYQAAITHFPRDRQVFLRSLKTNRAVIPIQGEVRCFSQQTSGCGATAHLSLKIERDGLLFDTKDYFFPYTANDAYLKVAVVDFQVEIMAERRNYHFALSILGSDGRKPLGIAEADEVVAGDLYLINGQSNAYAMQWAGTSVSARRPFVRSFGTLTDSSSASEEDNNWYIAQGDQDQFVFLSERVEAIGFVGQWGLKMGQMLSDSLDIPIAIMNGAR